MNVYNSFHKIVFGGMAELRMVMATIQNVEMS